MSSMRETPLSRADTANAFNSDRQFSGSRTDLPDPPDNASECFDGLSYAVHYWKQALRELGSMLFHAFAAIFYRNFASLFQS